MKTKAVIFDLDGTLLDSMHIWASPDYYGTIEEGYKSIVVLKPGVYKFLESLQQNGIRMVLATATDRDKLMPALHRNKMYGFFEKIFTCSEVGASKNVPLIYYKALEYLGLDKDEVWVFEDAFYAVDTAKSAGFKVAAIQDKWAGTFTYGKRMTRKEIMEMCDLYIEDYTKLSLHQLG